LKLSENSMDWNNMKNLDKHIDEFAKLMNEKGFDGYFLCNAGFPGKLKDSLHQHLSEVLRAENKVRPFYLSTYSLWNDEHRPYVQCDIRVNYDQQHGLRIDQVEAKFANQYGTIRDFKIPLKANSEMPSREKINSIVGTEKKRMKL
jgi:hypothetical protein